MKRFAAHFISIVIIPLLAPTYLFTIIFLYFPQLAPNFTSKEQILATLYIFAATSLLPFILVFILYKRKVISTWTLDHRKDRIIPQLFSCMNYLFICIFMIYRFGIGNALSLSMLATTVSVIVISIITPYWKISTHAAGAWGMFACITVLYLKFPNPAFTVPYIIIGLSTVAVCFARLYLRVHTLMQVIAGSALGNLVGFSVFYIFLSH
jgi:membrane-associated phospholipid phosphatase